MASDRTKAAVEELKAALEEDGANADVISAQLNGMIPGDPAIRGNYADLQRMGAIAQTGVMPTPPGQQDVETDDITEAFTTTNPDVEDLSDDGSLGSMTKDELLAEADRRGVSVSSSATKAEITAALGG